MAKSAQTLNSIVRLLKDEFSPSRLFLFGSRAAKIAKSESDYDFVMVLPKYTGDRMKMWEKCRELIRKKCEVSADVFTYSEDEFQNSTKDFSSIPETALNTGREIDLGSAKKPITQVKARAATKVAARIYELISAKLREKSSLG